MPAAPCQGTPTNAATSSRSGQPPDLNHVLIVSRWLPAGVDIVDALELTAEQTAASYQKCFFGLGGGGKE